MVFTDELLYEQGLEFARSGVLRLGTAALQHCPAGSLVVDYFYVSHPVMSSSNSNCTELPFKLHVLNPDISGVGVRISFYLQTFLLGQLRPFNL